MNNPGDPIAVSAAKEPALAGSMQRVVGLRTFHAVMAVAAREGWSEDLLLAVCKRKFGRVRQGVGALRESYRSMLEAQAND